MLTRDDKKQWLLTFFLFSLIGVVVSGYFHNWVFYPIFPVAGFLTGWVECYFRRRRRERRQATRPDRS